MASNRIGRINEEIQRELAELIRSLKDPRVQTMISITRVDTTPDLRYSKIYVSVLEEARSQDAIRGLKSAGGWLRRELGSRLQLRYTPELVSRSTIRSNTARTCSTCSRSSSGRRPRGRRKRPMTRAEFCAFVREHDNFVILTHRRPDGDTIGCASALCLGLRQLGKSAAVLRNEQFTPRFAALLEGLVCEDAPADACVISTDIASEGLLSFDAVRLGLTPVCAVDHHGSNSLACPKLVEADKAACGEIVHALLTELGVTVTKRIAECLYTAISTDTGCFKFSNTSANTHRTAAALIDAGADVYPINKVFFDTKSFARLRLEAKLTDTMEFYAGGEVGVCTMPKKLLAAFTVTEDDLDSISGFARSIEGVKIGVMIREVEDGLGKISLRTEAPYDASAICQRLGGGGHAAAAGASVPGGIAGAKAAILRALAESGVRL